MVDKLLTSVFKNRLASSKSDQSRNGQRHMLGDIEASHPKITWTISRCHLSGFSNNILVSFRDIYRKIAKSRERSSLPHSLRDRGAAYRKLV